MTNFQFTQVLIHYATHEKPIMSDIITRLRKVVERT